MSFRGVGQSPRNKARILDGFRVITSIRPMLSMWAMKTFAEGTGHANAWNFLGHPRSSHGGSSQRLPRFCCRARLLCSFGPVRILRGEVSDDSAGPLRWPQLPVQRLLDQRRRAGDRKPADNCPPSSSAPHKTCPGWFDDVITGDDRSGARADRPRSPAFCSTAVTRRACISVQTARRWQRWSQRSPECGRPRSPGSLRTAQRRLNPRSRSTSTGYNIELTGIVSCSIDPDGQDHALPRNQSLSRPRQTGKVGAVEVGSASAECSQIRCYTGSPNEPVAAKTWVHALALALRVPIMAASTLRESDVS